MFAPPARESGKPGALATAAAAIRNKRLTGNRCDIAGDVWKTAIEKKYVDQGEEDEAWYAHKNHILVFTAAGKPVYSRYGNEDNLLGLSATLSAIIGKLASFFF